MFQNREDAALQLAEKLKVYKDKNPFVLALPRGGIRIGYEIAHALGAPLDVLVVRKIGLPWNPELGVGAIAPGVQVLDRSSLDSFNIQPSEIQDLIDREQQELERRQRLYQQEGGLPDLTGKTVILVDDGLATGVTMHAAILAIKKRKHAKLIVAVPVGPLETINALEKLVDQLICLEVPPIFSAVSAFYLAFPQVLDEEVIHWLKQAKEERDHV